MKSLLILFLFSSSAALAQPIRPNTTTNDTLKSIRVLGNNQVVLSIYAPKATEVSISGDFSGGFPPFKLNKKDNGIWSVNLGSLKPDVYTYDLTVNSVKTFDPKTQYKEGKNGLSNLFQMPGQESEYCALKNVPHGKVETV